MGAGRAISAAKRISDSAVSSASRAKFFVFIFPSYYCDRLSSSPSLRGA